MSRPLLMIPGPIEISPSVQTAFGVAPPSHVSPACIAAFGASLAHMRTVWGASEDAQPVILAGSGTLAMDFAVANLVDAGDRVVVVNTGYFSDRIGEMALRRGAVVEHVRAEVGRAPLQDEILSAVEQLRPTHVFATHVDTSTGVRVDAQAICSIAAQVGAMTVFDGVCATAGERFNMAEWGADVYLTASQKAIGLPPGLGLLVMSERAVARRSTLRTPPPLYLDAAQWLPIMRAYEAQKPSYFATPSTNLVLALATGLKELLTEGMDGVVTRHQKAAQAMRAAWSQLGLEHLGPTSFAANTLSALRYPAGVDANLVASIAQHGAIVAGGLHPACKAEYFRVGHMGWVTTQPDDLVATVRAVELGLRDHGYEAQGAEAAFRTAWEG